MHIHKDDRPLLTAMICLIAVYILNDMSTRYFWGHPVGVAYASLCIVWTMTIQKRILQKNLRILLELVGLSLLLLFCEQIARYDYFEGLEKIRRLLWYAYYIPLILIPLFSFGAALCIGRETDDSPLRFWKWMIPVSVFLIFAILTNDAHQLAFRFTSSNWSNDYKYGELYYAAALWITVGIAAAFGLTLRRCRLYRSKHAAWIPALFLFGGLLLFLLMFLDGGSVLRYKGRKLFQFQEIYCLTLIGFWESCIRIGLIPSNRDYERLFDVSSLCAQIADYDGAVIHRAAGAETLTLKQMRQADAGAKMLDHNLRLQSKHIHGGRVYWVDDLTAISRINGQLADTAEQLGEENALLERENELYEQKLRYETQSRLYDEIARQLRPQLAEIEELIGSDSSDKRGETRADFHARLSRAVVLGAYIKRRANLYLIAEQRKSISFSDLLLCITESLEYVKLSGIPCGAQLEEDGAAAAEKVLLLYDFFEKVLEAALPEVRAVMVSLRGGKREELLIELSMPSKLSEIRMEMPKAGALGGVLRCQQEDDSCFVSLCFDGRREATGV